jgi:extradiol dioxygenase family protein
MSAARIPFHLAFPVDDLEAARAFYCDVLGCNVGRSAERWIDFDFHGHQLSAHLVDAKPSAAETNEVDGDGVPVRHFGLVLPWAEWQATRDALVARGASFLIEPRVRFRGEPGEQATMFLLDPSGNAIELKSFRDPSKLFATS